MKIGRPHVALGRAHEQQFMAAGMQILSQHGFLAARLEAAELPTINAYAPFIIRIAHLYLDARTSEIRLDIHGSLSALILFGIALIPAPEILGYRDGSLRDIWAAKAAQNRTYPQEQGCQQNFLIVHDFSLHFAS